jgi:predicted transcriptional regulator
MTQAPHIPTDQTRAEVSALKSFGNKDEDIASYLGICADTLVKYYKQELSVAAIKANAVIAKRLYQTAKEGDVKAMMFWLKTRARWREKDPEDNEGIKSIVEKLLDKLVD